jgi:hypothetical protein
VAHPAKKKYWDKVKMYCVGFKKLTLFYFFVTGIFSLIIFISRVYPDEGRALTLQQHNYIELLPKRILQLVFANNFYYLKCVNKYN